MLRNPLRRARASAARAGMPQRGRDHMVLGTPLHGPWPEGARWVLLGVGCFWAGERAFWGLDGVVTTAAGFTPEHTEVVLVVYEPARCPLDALLDRFFASHDAGARQHGPLYRSVIVVPEGADEGVATAALRERQRGRRRALTTIHVADDLAAAFTYAAADQQQHLVR